MITTDVILPLVGSMLGLIIVPPAIFFSGGYCSRFFSRLPLTLPPDNRFVCESRSSIYLHSVPNSLSSLLVRYVYPGLFAMAALSLLAGSAQNILSGWAQVIRDKEFLLELRL